MRDSDKTTTPDLIGEAVAPIFEELDHREQRALLAILERMAAESYRGWIDEVDGETAKAGLLKAAENEDGIAEILETIEADYETIEADLHRRFPQLDGLFASVLDGRPLKEQLQLQHAAESGAAELFKSLAAEAESPKVERLLLECSETEHDNAEFLADDLDAF